MYQGFWKHHERFAGEPVVVSRKCGHYNQKPLRGNIEVQFYLGIVERFLRAPLLIKLVLEQL